jgi:hypothetical protein
MSDEDIDVIGADVADQPEVANTNSGTKDKDNSANDRLMNHLERQAQIIEQQSLALKEMQDRLASFGSHKTDQEQQSSDDDDEPAYMTKKQMAQMQSRLIEEAELRATDRSRKEKIDYLDQEIGKPEVEAVVKQLLEKDEFFKESVQAIWKSEPVKARELVLKKAKQVMAKRASVPKAMTTASTSSAGNGVSDVSTQNRNVTSINVHSSEADKLAFAQNFYNNIMKR